VSALFLGALARIVSNDGGVNDSLNCSAPPFALDAEEGTGAAANNGAAPAVAADVAVVGPMSSANIAGLLLVVVVVLAEAPSSWPPKAKPKLNVSWVAGPSLVSAFTASGSGSAVFVGSTAAAAGDDVAFAVVVGPTSSLKLAGLLLLPNAKPKVSRSCMIWALTTGSGSSSGAGSGSGSGSGGKRQISGGSRFRLRR
jgi:hypothetical protein